jgi:hypothetical protein
LSRRSSARREGKWKREVGRVPEKAGPFWVREREARRWEEAKTSSFIGLIFVCAR